MRTSHACGFTATILAALLVAPVHAHEPPATLPPAVVPHGSIQRLTLDEAKERARANSKVIAMAAMNIEGKDYAVRATRADYFPKLIGSLLYFHFDSPLGSVLTTRGAPRLGIGARQIAVNLVNQDQTLSTIGVAQPLTALLKIRQGVKIAQADEQIAQAQLDQATRAVVGGTEQLYWGLLAARRVRDGAQAAVTGIEPLAKGGALEVRTALMEGRQALQAANAQVAAVQEQLNALLDLPACTTLELVEPPLPGLAVRCADEAIGLALAVSPQIREAEQNVVKAEAAVKAAKVDYLPNVNVIGGYAHQEGIPAIQPDIGYLGIQGSYTFFEWGKRYNTVKERQVTVFLAQQKLAQTQDEVRQKAQKAFREIEQHREALQLATEMAQLRKEAVKKAAGLKAGLDAGKDLLEAEVNVVKEELAYRTAHVELSTLIGR
jgi:outer membrane protein